MLKIILKYMLFLFILYIHYCFAEQQEIKIKTKYTENTYSMLKHPLYSCPGSALLNRKKPAKFKNFKVKKGFDYYYGEIKFHTKNINNIFPFVIEIKDNDWSNAILYLDRDVDYDFSKGVSIEYPQKGSSITGFRCPLELDAVYEIKGEKITKKYNLTLVAHFERNAAMRMVYSGWYGVINLEDKNTKKEYPFVILDWSCDGDYSLTPITCRAREYKPASLYVDFNKNGEIEEDVEELEINKTKYVGNYSIKLESISPTGEEVIFNIEKNKGRKHKGEDVLEVLQEYPKKGNRAPEFDFVDLKGERISLSKLKGKVVIVDFWATWCGPCLNSIPSLKRCYERYGDKVIFIGISLDKDKNRLKIFLKKEQIVWPQYYDGLVWENKIAKLYKVRAIPSLFLIDKEGIIYDNKGDSTNLENRINEILQKN